MSLKKYFIKTDRKVSGMFWTFTLLSIQNK